MMISNRYTIAVLAAMLIAACSTAIADYSMDWYTMDSGGITVSSGGAFEMGGTSGQADAGQAMTGGTFSLTGGFWSFKPSTINWLIADLNHDGCVEWADFGIFATHWQESGCTADDWCEGTDFNHDGTVEWADFGTFASQWQECM